MKKSTLFPARASAWGHASWRRSGCSLRKGSKTSQPINGANWEGASSHYTVQQGDTLQSVAMRIWGDSNFWYLIADANGLNAGSQLTAGQSLWIPNKVANAHNGSSTYRVYDPNLYFGDTSPTHPPKPQQAQGCGVVGQIIETVVAVAVAYFTAGAALGAMGVIGAGGATSTGALMAAATLPKAMAAGAIGGAVGNIVSQGVGLATGLQRKFDFAAVGMAAIGGAVGAGLGPNLMTGAGVFAPLGDSISSFGVGMLRGAAADLITQGLGVATGLQSKFDWAGVAGAAIGGGATNVISSDYASNIPPNRVISGEGTAFISGMAGGIVGASTRTLVKGIERCVYRTMTGTKSIRFLPSAETLRCRCS